MWACDSPPTRSSGMVHLGFNASRQATPWLGASECSNGNYNAVPCEPVARVTHLGYTFAHGNDVSATARVSGPTGGFGWAFRWEWAPSVARGFAPPGLTDNPPVTLTLGSPQVEPDKVLLLAFPYPRDATFRVTMYSNAGFAPPAALPSYCRPASNLCSWNFSAAASIAEVRSAPNADRFFFDAATGHLYVRMTVQSGCACPPPPSPRVRRPLTHTHTHTHTRTRARLCSLHHGCCQRHPQGQPGLGVYGAACKGVDARRHLPAAAGRQRAANCG